MKKFLFSISVIALCAACSGKGNNSVDGSGNCTQQFVDDYNAMRYSTDLAKDCANFKANHGRDVSCRARDLSSGNTTQASASTVYAACDSLSSSGSGSSSTTSYGSGSSSTSYSSPSYNNDGSSTSVGTGSSNSGECTYEFKAAVMSMLRATQSVHCDFNTNVCTGLDAMKAECSRFRAKFSRDFSCLANGSQRVYASELFDSCEKMESVEQKLN